MSQSDGPQVSASVAQYAKRFGVVVKVDKCGCFGDMWDWVASPANPHRHPTVQPFRSPCDVDPKMAVRVVAERMGTGRYDHHGFKLVREEVQP